MNSVYLFLILFLAVMLIIYFIPYKKLRGKVFNRLIWKDPSKLHFMSYTTPLYSIKLDRDRDGNWSYIHPERWLANNVKVRRLIVRLSEIKVLTRHTIKRDYSEYGIGKNGELELQYGSKVIVISFGSKSDDGSLVYVKSSEDSDVLGVSVILLSSLPQSENDFKDMLLFNQYYSNIAGIEIRFNEHSVVIDRRDDGWMMNGNHVFDENAKPIIEKILSTEASGFAKEGTRLPAKQISIIVVKLVDGGTPITRYLFEDELYPKEFLVPLNGKIMLVKKELIESFNL